MHSTSLVISVYDKIDELDLVIRALQIQTNKNFDVIIAEDGESEKVRNFVRSLKYLHFSLNHVTQKDEGFRKNRILNKAILNSDSDQLIFIDGDCIPHSDFINQHILHYKSGTVLCGRRVALGKKLSNLITPETIHNREFEKIGLKHFVDSLGSSPESSKHIEEGISLGKFFTRKSSNKNAHILGCNFSIDKDLLYKVNGFDENYKGAGIGEDTDVEYRLRLIDAKFISVRNRAIVFHLFHKKTLEDPANLRYFNNVKYAGVHQCKNGLLKLD